MPLSKICERYSKLAILSAAAIKLEWQISEYISTSTPTYLKMKKFHDINFLGVFDSYRNWLLNKKIYIFLQNKHKFGI